MLTPEEIQAARKQYGLDTPATSSGGNFDSSASQPVDHAARMRRIDKLLADQKAASAASHESLLSKIGHGALELGKGIAKPFVTTGVTGLSALEGAGRALTGDVAGANRVLTQGYNVPGFGQIQPVGATIGQEGGIRHELGRMVGTGAEIAATLAGGEGAGSVAEQAGKEALGQAAKQGAKQGALTGATAGFGSSVQEENASPLGVVGGTLGGGLLGGALGGALGAGANVLQKSGRAANKAAKEAADLDKLAEDVMPKATANVKKEALKSFRVPRQGILSKDVIQASAKDREMAKAVQGLYDIEASPQEKILAINNGIKDLAESHVRPVLESNPRPYNMNTFKAHLADINIPRLFKGDPANTYGNVQEMAAEIADKFPKTKLGAWQARQAFDREVEREFPRVFDGSQADNAIKHAVSDVRSAWNDFIVEGLPENNGVKKAFKQMSRMYEAADNITDKGVSQVGTNIIERSLKSKFGQGLKAIAPYAIGAGGVGALGALGKTLGGENK